MHSKKGKHGRRGSNNNNTGNDSNVPIRTLYVAPIKPNVGYFLTQIRFTFEIIVINLRMIYR